MLRELIKYINSLEGYTAYTDRGGIKLNGTYYGPDQFHKLPAECQSDRVQIIETEGNGLAFAGEWAFLSNMYRCNIMFEDMLFTSAEQCFQFRKAHHLNCMDDAQEIILESDPFVCKRIGGDLTANEDWQQSQEAVMEDVNEVLAKL